ncbi:MAG: conjugal transfer protein TraK [Candidatus Moraniibacteriota bacterium]|nr:MAG: conjugal transfer protein TraK [Candidatus Moranbacteria bacterium]
MAEVAYGSLGFGAVLAVRPSMTSTRYLGAVLLGIGAALLASPAFADQNLAAKDNGQINCVASAKDLTRISLVGDQFVSISKADTGVPTEDFKVVHDPKRGDIYLSIPEGYAKPSVNFFGISDKGFVYKFVCKPGGADAEQVFVTNLAIDDDKAADWEARTTPEATAMRLVSAMQGWEPVPGFNISQTSLEPRTVNNVELQVLGEYRGADVSGRILRVKNTGDKPLKLDENTIAGKGIVAFSAALDVLPPAQVTTIYLVERNGGSQ